MLSASLNKTFSFLPSYKQECNHGTCVEFPCRVVNILMNLYSRFSNALKSNSIFGGLMHQGGRTKYEGVSKMTDKSMLEEDKNYFIRKKVCFV